MNTGPAKGGRLCYSFDSVREVNGRGDTLLT